MFRVIKRIGGKWIEGGKPMNKQVDGDKFICLDRIVRSDSHCLIYSFGISNDWTFEDQMDKLGNVYFLFSSNLNVKVQAVRSMPMIIQSTLHRPEEQISNTSRLEWGREILI